MDIGDHVSPTEPDPTPDEVADPEHPDYVEPYADATPVPGFDPWREAQEFYSSLGHEARFGPRGRFS